MSLFTGRVGITETGEVFVATPAAVELLGAPAASAAPAGPPEEAVNYGQVYTMTDGTPLPSGIWEVQSGTLYAGGDVTVREVFVRGS